MPPHQRSPMTGAQAATTTQAAPGAPPNSLPRSTTPPSPGAAAGQPPGAFFPGGPSDNRWVNSTLLLLSQKLRYAARNDKVLEHNLLVLSKRLRALEEKLDSMAVGNASGTAVSGVKESLDAFRSEILDMRAQINEMRETAASREQVAEIKSLLETINPLDFVTIAQVKDLIEARLGKNAKK